MSKHLTMKVTSKSFNFASKRNLPFYFVSAADGTNVVSVFKAAIQAGLRRKKAPPEDEFFEVLELDLVGLGFGYGYF